MDAAMIASPLAGAVIGYFTNYVAIKMLFRPYNQIKIGPVALPFTPGLIPKEKAGIARALGGAVGEKILTEDTLKDYLLKEEMVGYVSKASLKAIKKAEEDKTTLNGAGYAVFSSKWNGISNRAADHVRAFITEAAQSDTLKSCVAEAVYAKISALLNNKIGEAGKGAAADFLEYTFNSVLADFIESGKIQEITEKALWNFLLSLKNDERKISQVVSYSAIAEFKDYLSVKIPEGAAALAKVSENPEIEEFLKDKLGDALQSIAGPFIGMFINEDDIYIKVKNGLLDYFDNPENAGEIEHMVDIAVDAVSEKTIGEAAAIFISQLRESTVNRFIGLASGEIIKPDNIRDIIKGAVERNGNRTFMEILTSADRDFNKKLREYIAGTCDIIAENIVKAIDREKAASAVRKALDTEICRIPERLGIDKETIAAVFGNMYKKAVLSVAPGFIKNLNMASIAEDKINSFDMKYLEEIILSIAKKELSAITYLGGVLGFIIGLVPAVISLI